MGNWNVVLSSAEICQICSTSARLLVTGEEERGDNGKMIWWYDLRCVTCALVIRYAGEHRLRQEHLEVNTYQTHWPNEALRSDQSWSQPYICLTHLQLDRFSGETLPNKRSLVDHPLPALVFVLARLDDLEHLLLGNASDLGQGHSVLGGAIFSSVLDRG